MVLRIRLARFGRKREPFYNIVVAQARFVLFFCYGFLRPLPSQYLNLSGSSCYCLIEPFRPLVSLLARHMNLPQTLS
jgi:hypothetical protein